MQNPNNSLMCFMATSVRTLPLGNNLLTKFKAEPWGSYPGAEGGVNICVEEQLRVPGEMANWPPPASPSTAPAPADAGGAAAASAPGACGVLTAPGMRARLPGRAQVPALPPCLSAGPGLPPRAPAAPDRALLCRCTSPSK